MRLADLLWLVQVKFTVKPLGIGDTCTVSVGSLGYTEINRANNFFYNELVYRRVG